MEDKQAMLDKFCETLQMTRSYQNLKELRYLKDDRKEEWVVPVFKDGTGEPNELHPHGYYAVNVTADSNAAIIWDMCRNFVNKHM